MEINNRDVDSQRDAFQLLERLGSHYNDDNSTLPLRLAPIVNAMLPKVVVAEVEANSELLTQGHQVLKNLGYSACFDHPNPEIFFPEKGKDRAKKIEEAKQVCSGCVIKSKCLDDAIGREEQYGIWGGLTEDERRKVLRKRKHKSRAT